VGGLLAATTVTVGTVVSLVGGTELAITSGNRRRAMARAVAASDTPRRKPE
jgi:hypothetical protein